MAVKKLVKVKILKHVGAYVPEQVIEVEEEEAKHLCHVNVTDSFVGEPRAVMLEVAKKIEKEKMKVENLTAAEAKELGVVNVASPE